MGTQLHDSIYLQTNFPAVALTTQRILSRPFHTGGGHSSLFQTLPLSLVPCLVQNFNNETVPLKLGYFFADNSFWFTMGRGKFSRFFGVK